MYYYDNLQALLTGVYKNSIAATFRTLGTCIV